MINNDILRRIRYIFDYSDTRMIDIFRLAEYQTTRVELKSWLTKEDEAGFVECPDKVLATFLNGLIIQNRGMKGDAVPVPEEYLSNNMILMKLKIALALSSEEVLDILSLAEFRISKHELSAFFRRVGHRHYRACLDQFLRNFLTGMKLKYRDKRELQKAETKIKDKDENRKTKGLVGNDITGKNNRSKGAGVRGNATKENSGRGTSTHEASVKGNKNRKKDGEQGRHDNKKAGDAGKKHFRWPSTS